MALLSVKYITPLKIVSLCIVIIGYVLHTVGITAEEWDGIHGNNPYAISHFDHFDAYQNLWWRYDKDAKSFSFPVYGHGDVKTGIPGKYCK